MPAVPGAAVGAGAFTQRGLGKERIAFVGLRIVTVEKTVRSSAQDAVIAGLVAVCRRGIKAGQAQVLKAL
jgi:hypothetical protein